MKLILLSDSVFSDRDYDRFGINTLLERKVEVELWCFQNIRHEIIRNNTNLFEGENEKINRYIFSDYMDLERKKIDLTGVFIIDKRSGFYGKYNTCWFQLHGGIIVKLNSALSSKKISFWTEVISIVKSIAKALEISIKNVNATIIICLVFIKPPPNALYYYILVFKAY